jgi:hypothetical protein
MAILFLKIHKVGDILMPSGNEAFPNQDKKGKNIKENTLLWLKALTR